MIYIDASRYSNTENRTGVENYSYFLINELIRQDGENITLVTPRKIALNVKQIVIPFPRLWTLVRLSWEIWINKKINNIFVPSHVLPLIHPKSSIITIHDVVFRYSPKSYSLLSRIYLDWAAKFAVKHASKIITPSEATKKDLIHFYKADHHKIHVIPLGYEAPTNTPTQAESEKWLSYHSLIAGGYFLSLGRIEQKKGTDTLINSFREFAKKNENIKLVLAGFPGYGGKEILKSIPDSLKNRIVRPGYVREKEKLILLKNALCLIFPSRFEGFGLPLLEAMFADTPIIASDIPSSREVAKNCALFFRKENIHELAKLMEKMVSDSALRFRLIEKGRQVAKNYSWNNCAKKVKNILLE